jgi:hypothetical protein
MEPVVAARPGGWYRHDRLVVDLSIWLNEKNPRLAEERRFLVAPSSRGEQPLLSHRSFSETAGDGQTIELPVSLELFRALAGLAADRNDVDASR